MKRNFDSQTASACNIGHREQFNLRSHYIDNNNIYGTSDAELNALRLGQNGLFKTSSLPNSNREGLPLSNPSICTRGLSQSSFGCFSAGDDRADANVF